MLHLRQQPCSFLFSEEGSVTDTDGEWLTEDECECILKPYIPGQLPLSTPGSILDMAEDDGQFMSALNAADSRVDYNRQIGLLVGEENLRHDVSDLNQGFGRFSIAP